MPGLESFGFGMKRDSMPAERRSVERAPCSHLAEIRIGASVALQAIIKDISPNGARLQIPENEWLPTRFEISVSGIGLNRRATCRWRRGNFAGLEFDTIEN
ncbi:MAG: PilZ domain-containing protein [Oricola sp.]